MKRPLVKSGLPSPVNCSPRAAVYDSATAEILFFLSSSSRGASVDALRVDFKFLEMAECCFKAGLKNKAGIDFFSKTNKQTNKQG